MCVSDNNQCNYSFVKFLLQFPGHTADLGDFVIRFPKSSSGGKQTFHHTVTEVEGLHKLKDGVLRKLSVSSVSSRGGGGKKVPMYSVVDGDTPGSKVKNPKSKMVVHQVCFPRRWLSYGAIEMLAFYRSPLKRLSKSKCCLNRRVCEPDELLFLDRRSQTPSGLWGQSLTRNLSTGLLWAIPAFSRLGTRSNWNGYLTISYCESRLLIMQQVVFCQFHFLLSCIRFSDDFDCRLIVVGVKLRGILLGGYQNW